MGIRHHIIISLLLTALFSVLIHSLRDEMDTEEIRKNRYWVAKTHQSGRYPILFGGDSRVFRGISPEAFTADRGPYEAYNFAYWSNGMGKAYLQGLDEKLDPDSDFRMVVLGISPHSLTPRAAACSHYLFEKGRSREQILQNLYMSRIQEFFAPMKVREVYRRLSGKTGISNYRIIYHGDGWVESWWLQPDTSYSTRFYEEIFTDNQVSEEVVAGLLEQVESWTARGIAVAGFRPPTSHAIRRLEHEKGAFDEEAFTARFENAGGHWVDVDPDLYATFDGNHLEHESARALSADLSAELAEMFPSP